MADTTSLVSIGAPARVAPRRRWMLAGLTWVLAAVVMHLLDGQVDLANQAMLLVLASALSALWLPVRATLTLSTLALLAFNWALVPPRGTFSVDLRQHAVLLGAMLCLNTLIALLMVRLRSRAELATAQAAQAEQLRLWSDTLRDTAEPLDHAPTLQQALSHWVGAPVSLLLPTTGDADAWLGTPDADQREALHLAQQQSRAMGPGTGWHDEQPGWTLPLRARHHSLGAAHLPLPADAPPDPTLLLHAQALCDRLGAELDRSHALRAAQQARDDAQAQVLRSTLLAAVAHDHRTPLATIMGAASSLLEQADRLSPEQRHRLAQTVLEQTAQLSRLTDNTLQLARLDRSDAAPGTQAVQLRLDWESVEEIAGAVLRRARQREPARRIHVRLEPALPLLHCDAVLLAQLLDNLVDNALKYSPPEAPVELLARRLGGVVMLAVRDRGPGIALAQRERVFQLFQRGEAPTTTRGAGIGLAVCRAIAHAHGGELTLRQRAHGGCSVECRLPVQAPPAPPQQELTP
jgi:two-component system sensor histidine kinase KdpD